MKNKKINRIIAAAIIIIIPAVICIIMLSFPQNVLVKDRDSKFFHAKAILIAGDIFICLKDSTLYEKRKQALNNREQDDNMLTLISLKDIITIEIIPDLEEDDPSGEETTDASNYLGRFIIKVTGHKGYLYLRAKNGKIYGSVKFPNWAKGVTEPLKKLRISRGRISFTRSVTTPKELRRVGSATYFTQKYYGKYYRNGNIIKGTFIKSGAKSMWEAYKTK